MCVVGARSVCRSDLLVEGASMPSWKKGLDDADASARKAPPPLPRRRLQFNQDPKRATQKSRKQQQEAASDPNQDDGGTSSTESDEFSIHTNSRRATPTKSPRDGKAPSFTKSSLDAKRRPPSPIVRTNSRDSSAAGKTTLLAAALNGDKSAMSDIRSGHTGTRRTSISDAGTVETELSGTSLFVKDQVRFGGPRKPVDTDVTAITRSSTQPSDLKRSLSAPALPVPPAQQRLRVERAKQLDADYRAKSPPAPASVPSTVVFLDSPREAAGRAKPKKVRQPSAPSPPAHPAPAPSPRAGALVTYNGVALSPAALPTAALAPAAPAETPRKVFIDADSVNVTSVTVPPGTGPTTVCVLPSRNAGQLSSGVNRVAHQPLGAGSPQPSPRNAKGANFAPAPRVDDPDRGLLDAFLAGASTPRRSAAQPQNMVHRLQQQPFAPPRAPAGGGATLWAGVQPLGQLGVPQQQQQPQQQQSVSARIAERASRLQQWAVELEARRGRG